MSGHDEKEKFPDYLEISGFDLLRYPELLFRKIQQKMQGSKTVCLECHDYITWKFTSRFWSFKCKCGIHIFYPPKKGRNYAYGYRFISKQEYCKSRRVGKD